MGRQPKEPHRLFRVKTLALLLLKILFCLFVYDPLEAFLTLMLFLARLA